MAPPGRRTRSGGLHAGALRGGGALGAGGQQLDPNSVVEVAFARCARAKAIAALERVEEGERLAREAVALVDQTQFPIDRADARMDLAEVLVLAGRPDDAAEVLQDALHLHEQKGNLVSAERTRALLDELGR